MVFIALSKTGSNEKMTTEIRTALQNKQRNFIEDEQIFQLWFVEHFKIGASVPGFVVLPHQLMSF